MLNTILIAILIFLELIFYVIFIDVILSWLVLFGVNFRPKFIADIIDPMYKFIKSIIPTTFGPIDLTPIIVILIIYFLRGLIFFLNPGLQDIISNYMK
ncbi:MAG: YggT family protein [Candidatus Gracilibacteria bacterium]